ncbi:MAG: FHA domain-containing protein [Anaerolineales bacterium]|nr:FHA domain-containing protein [Anaerolineales bacterium]
MGIKVMLMSGPDDGKEVELEGVEFTIGRRKQCDICVPFDTAVSREHARLVINGKVLLLKDEDSRNGTFIGRRRIKEVELLGEGDMFRVGNTWLRVQEVR